jgi:hypothetical protein
MDKNESYVLTRARAKRLISRNVLETDKDKPLFQLLFLRNDENQTVMVEEVEEINFGKVKERLEQGDSVFITLKPRKKVEKNLAEMEYSAETWYFTNI